MIIHWFLWEPLREVLNYETHSFGFEARWLATAVRIHEGAMLAGFDLCVNNLTKLLMLVYRTLSPELRMKKSSLKMRSPGREVRLTVCKGMPSLGKLQVLKIRRVSAYLL